MTRSPLFVFATASLLLATACGGDDGGGGGGGGAKPTENICELGPNDSAVLLAAEPNNYSFMSQLKVAETLVAPRTELTFDWTGLTKDFSMHDIDPMQDIDMVAVIIWRVDNEELAVKLNVDSLAQSDFEAIAMIYTENAVSSGELFDFTEFGAPIDTDTLLDYVDPDVFPPDEHAYTVMVSTGTTPGKGTRMVQGFRMDPSSTNTEVVLDENSTKLTFTVDLVDLKPIQVPAGMRDITIDWSDIATNAMGAEFDPRAITEVVVGKFSQTTQELEDQFLDLDLIADELYWGNVSSGESFSLARNAAVRWHHAKTTQLRACTTAIKGKIFMPAAWSPTHPEVQRNQSGRVFAEHDGHQPSRSTGGPSGTSTARVWIHPS